MSKYFLILVSFFSLQLSAIEIDSVERAKIVREGQTELCNLIEYNSHALPEERRYTVVIDGDPNGINYVVEKHVNTPAEPFLSQQTTDVINAELAQTYSSYQIEMYIIVIRSLNFVVKAPLPQYPTARDIFTNHLYDNQTNIAELRGIHQNITTEIINSTFQARGRDCLVYSRAEYSGAYAPGKSGVWVFSDRVAFTAQSPTYPKLNELKKCHTDRCINNANVVMGGLEIAMKEVAHQFFETAKYMAIKGAIMTTYTTEGMSDIFEQLHPGADYESLTEPERRRALSVFAGYSMGENGIELEERYANRIIASTPSAQVPEFLDHLSQVSELNSSASYQGAKPNQALIRVLVHRMDDVGSGPNNYTTMMTSLTRIAMSNESFAAAHMPSTDQEWVDRRVYWDDWHALTSPPVGTHDYEVTLNDNGTVTVEKEVVDRLEEHIQGQSAQYYYTPHWDDSYTPIQIDPFDFVIFTNRSSLGMLQVAGAAPDQPFIAPAIFLKYADDKAFNTNAITVTAIVLDVVAITTGPFAILGAYSAGNFALAAYEALQFLGSSLNLVANAIASDEFKEAVGVFNVLIAGWGLAKISVTGAKYTADYLAAVTRGDVQPAPLQSAQLYCTKYDAITDWSNVEAATKEEMRRMREMLGKSCAGAINAVNDNHYAGDWNRAKVLAYTKPNRPLPNLYLKPDYIAAHVAKFDQEGGAFIVVKSWIEGGSYSSFPLGKFTMLKSEMDDLIADYRLSGNVDILEDGLGYERGQLAGLEDELYVMYVDKTKFAFEMPSGKEIGANNLWEPAGLTSGGKHEAVIYDKLNHELPLTHNKSLPYLQSQFTNQKVKNF
jgi:hypothetical protein